MFRKKEKSPESEVLFLRGLVKDLSDRLMSLSGESFQKFNAEKRLEEALKEEANGPTTTLIGKIEGMEALNEQDQRDKEQAIEFAESLLGGGSYR